MQSQHVVRASSSLVQKEECHHLAPADKSHCKVPMCGEMQQQMCVGFSVGILMCLIQSDIVGNFYRPILKLQYH